MRFTIFDRCLLAVLAIFLGIVALRPMAAPGVALAQEEPAYHVYVEPGVHMLVAPDKTRQVLGKVVVDLTNGNVWGFPTTTKSPYPVDSIKTTPPVSEPIYLGRYDLAAMHSNR